jgi:hypothetical protein
VFSKETQSTKINKLSLPNVRNVKIVTDKDVTTISWDKPVHENLIGYNVYRFDPIAFIPKNHINKKIITTESYIEQTIDENTCYIVKPVYQFDKKQVEGPGSAPKKRIKKPSNLEQAGGLGGRTIP